MASSPTHRLHPPWVLTIDIGTSSCRVGLRDGEGRPLPEAWAQRRYHVRHTPDGGAELDPERLLELLVDAMDEVHAKMAPSQDVAAVALGTFWHSLVGAGANGVALTPVYLWMDSRSHREAARLRHVLNPAAVHARTGCVLHWSYWPAKLRHLSESAPGVFGRVHSWLSLGDYVLLRLLGVRLSSVSLAAATGLMNQHTCAWDDELREATAVSPAQLPEIVAERRWLGGLSPTFASRWPRFASAQWLPAFGDGFLSSVGAGCVRNDLAALMVGTSVAMRVLGPANTMRIVPGLFGYRVDERHLCIGGALNDGGSLFAWLKNSLQLPEPAVLEAALSAMKPDAHGLTVLPLWGGERSPGWADQAQGAIVGMGFHTTPVEILRAALEGVALRCLELDRRLREAVPLQAVVATGGALLASPAWMQILADALGRPLLASAEPEASSRGAALMALHALGSLSVEPASLAPVALREYLPDPEAHAIYREAAKRQTALYAERVPGAGADVTASSREEHQWS